MNLPIFVSATSGDLAEARALVVSVLAGMGYQTRVQPTFAFQGGTLQGKLRQLIDEAGLVIQLVGFRCGHVEETPEFGRISLTQFEARYAERQGKRVLYILVPASYPVPANDAETAEQEQMQQAYRASIIERKVERGEPKNHDELEKLILRIRDDLAELLKLAAERHAELLARLDNLPRQLANPQLLAETIRKEIETTAEKKIKALPDATGRGQKVAEIEKERDLALGRVDDLIKLIQAGLKEGATPIFQQATDILQKEGTDAALSYLDLKRPSAIESAKLHNKQIAASEDRLIAEKEARNQSLQPLALEAKLNETKLQFATALKLREQIAELAPDWFDARNYLGLQYINLAKYVEAEPHYLAAVKLARNDQEEATALNNLAHLYQATNRLKEAEPLMERSLKIDEAAFGKEHPKVATALNNLAALYQTTNRLKEAEPLMERVVTILEKSYGENNPKVATALNNLAALYKATNRLSEAEPLMERALKIDEAAYGKEHPNVAIRLNNLAQLYQATNRLSEAEPLMKRVVTIFEKYYGESHPNVAAAFNNLAGLLDETERLDEAEVLYRRALAIDEAAFGKEHPNVAIRLNNLALLYEVTNRKKEAVPLYERALEIYLKSLGAEHPRYLNVKRNYENLLQEMKEAGK